MKAASVLDVLNVGDCTIVGGVKGLLLAPAKDVLLLIILTDVVFIDLFVADMLECWLGD